jgi:4-oxalocrotonate tautomerase
MPIINFKITDGKTVKIKQKLINSIINNTTNILKKNANLIAITIQEINKENWIIAGKSLADLDQDSFYLDIKITDETNDKTQKANFIAQVFKDFSEILGNLNQESYIYIEDVRAASYGYGGKTQEYRYHEIK